MKDLNAHTAVLHNLYWRYKNLKHDPMWQRDLVPPPDTTTLDLLVSFKPTAQPEDGPFKGPKHVVVSLILH
jgi:hypothetical protein